MKVGDHVIIRKSRLNDADIGARIDRISWVTMMIYLTDENGSDRVCFEDELEDTDKVFQINKQASVVVPAGRPKYNTK